MAARGLGKGLDALIPSGLEVESKPKKESVNKETENGAGQETFVKITMVEPNREQPRKNFDEQPRYPKR